MLAVREIDSLREKSCLELMSQALQVKLANRGTKVALCSIINAKSGKCSEDCRFCVQSGHYATDAPVYPLKDKDAIFRGAEAAVEAGAEHFSLVTSGRGLPAPEVVKVADIIAGIIERFPIRVCASLGILGKEDFAILHKAGLTRYHHNLETSEEFFPKIVTTHTFEERVATIKAAQEEGLEVCAGGIFGLGESEGDRISMALTLRELQVDSVPLNILIPLAGTPLARQKTLAAREVLRGIALYRILLPNIPIRLAAGRETALQDFLSSAFLAGADGMMIGGYLTERGRSASKDTAFVEEMKNIWRSL
jgi:biotin synthase